jgi:hypothetical protein
VVFDHLDMTWEYEPQGYELDCGRYLPDFRLPDLVGGSTFVEVKAEWTVESLRKAFALTAIERVLMLGRIPAPEEEGPHFDLFTFDYYDFDCTQVKHSRVSLLPTSDGEFGLMPFGWAVSGPVGGPTDEWIAECARHTLTDWVRNPPLIGKAFAAGRSARFEFGESG